MLRIEADRNFTDAMRAAGAGLAAAIEVGLDRGADITRRALERQIGKTYSRTIPLSKSGKPKWTRSGDLARSVEVKSATGQRALISTGPAAKPIKSYPGGYAEKLRALPTGADGVNRTNDYPANAATIVEPQVQRAIEQEILNIIGQ